MRDCVERNQVPKVHAYSDHVFLVLHAPERGQGGAVLARLESGRPRPP
jgi:magnesium transporter